jgi:quercetin dioxygenase-like cupin family protein
MHKAWFKGRWFTFEEVTHGRVIERAKSIWWIRIRNKSGAVGWTDQHFAFEGIDVLGGPEPAQYRFYISARPYFSEMWKDYGPGIRMIPAVGTSGTVTIAEFQPGAKTPSHHHSFSQLDYVIDGKLNVVARGNSVSLTKNTGVLVPSDADHFVENASGSIARLLEFQPVRRYDLLPPRPAPAFAVAPKPTIVTLDQLLRVDFSSTATSSGRWGLSIIDAPADLTTIQWNRRNGVEQFFYALSGTMWLDSGDQERPLGEGEVAVIPATTTTLTLRFDPLQGSGRGRLLVISPSGWPK